MGDSDFQPMVMSGWGSTDPESIDDYVAAGGYSALRRVLSVMTPEDVICRVEAVGLLGRGGAGYPVARKWRAAREAPSDHKFVIANAYDADALSPIGQSLLEQMPHRVLEGLLIAAYAIGARDGVIYCRGESRAAIRRVRAAISQAEENGFVGPKAFGPGRAMRLYVALGWTGFVGGEETAAIAAIEGRRAMPVQRPPYPAERGLMGRPTVVNSAETLANVPLVVADGGPAPGSSQAGKTKVFSMQGNVRHKGLVESPLGVSLRQMVDRAGGAGPEGQGIKAVQIGGPTGACIPASAFDVPLGFESLLEVGAHLGSGRIEVIGNSACMVGYARDVMAYLTDEACGRCVPCRLGTKRVAGLLEAIASGLGEGQDLETLEELSGHISAASICGYGLTATSVVTSTLKHFRSEYLSHVEEKRCPTGQCKPSRHVRYRRRAVL